MPQAPLALLPTALLVLGVSGCGGGTDMSATDPPTSGATSGAASGPTGEPSTGTTTPPSEGLQKVRVVGEVVEVGDCVVVRDDNAITWTIVGDLAASLAKGERVQVTGAPDLTAEGCGGPVVRVVRVTVVG